MRLSTGRACSLRAAACAFVLLTSTVLAQSAHSHSEGSRPPSTARESPRDHVPPDPPQRPMGDMSNERMIELMGMDDGAARTMLMLDELEWREVNGADALNWDAQAWLGDDYNKAWFKSEGSRLAGEGESRNELLWDRIATRWWSLQAGVRHDVLEGPSRTWVALGVQGLAPFWWEVEATAYVGEQGRTALSISADYDLLLTQRLVLQPEVELNAYGKDDERNRVGSGLANTELTLRLRYEVRREFAPYIGVVWARLYGETADLAAAVGRDSGEVQYLAGLRVWF